jgi:hypothetical protein
VSERLDLERQLLELQGNTTELRKRERDALLPANQALYDQIQALKDQQQAAQDAADAAAIAAQAMQEILGQRDDLNRQLLQLQGNTAAIRALDLAKITDPTNKALQQQL